VVIWVQHFRRAVLARCVHLFSDGLDSIVSLKLLESFGIEVVPVRFYSVFFPLSRHRKPEEYRRYVAERFGVDVVVVDVTAEFVGLLERPPHGFGRWMNPCVDCRILMYRRAGEMMRAVRADFISTGEVVGQRPMTQFAHILPMMEREANLQGLILRPLTAKNLRPTRAEVEGLVERDKLLDIRGRSRRRQLALAKELGIEEPPQPAGGCLLTDANYAKKVKVLLRQGWRSLADFRIINAGRFFRLPSESRLIVGRYEAENNFLDRVRPPYALRLEPTSVVGPVALLFGKQDGEVLDIALSIVARYSDANEGEQVRLSLIRGDDDLGERVVAKEMLNLERYRV